MNNNKLQKSYFPALQDRTTKKITIGEALKDTASKYGDIEALVEVKQDGNIGRRWNYKNFCPGRKWGCRWRNSSQAGFSTWGNYRQGNRASQW